jgi:hypothetical protein
VDRATIRFEFRTSKTASVVVPGWFLWLTVVTARKIQLENRYEAGAAGVFAGGVGVDCDFAVVCVSGSRR